MTSSNGNSRLDRIEEILAATVSGLAETRKIVDSNARAIEANSSSLVETRAIVESTARTVAANADAIAENREAIASLREAVITFIDAVQAQNQRLDEIASEVRGLQTENRRILDRLERGEAGQE